MRATSCTASCLAMRWLMMTAAAPTTAITTATSATACTTIRRSETIGRTGLDAGEARTVHPPDARSPSGSVTGSFMVARVVSGAVTAGGSVTAPRPEESLAVIYRSAQLLPWPPLWRPESPPLSSPASWLATGCGGRRHGDLRSARPAV